MRPLIPLALSMAACSAVHAQVGVTFRRCVREPSHPAPLVANGTTLPNSLFSSQIKAQAPYQPMTAALGLAAFSVAFRKRRRA